ncbi:MAG: hypothetical protein A2096_07450 [Spirochaetes bacterium GWF1_41_5]|nr:MAG: hypothetical protein A2096_07450 [Spirochaetes bacterium GWF1_41_5]HBE02391.1 hypothetical protein [Spirochaetia bacterium]
MEIRFNIQSDDLKQIQDDEMVPESEEFAKMQQRRTILYVEDSIFAGNEADGSFRHFDCEI